MNNYISKKAAGVKSSHIHSQPKAESLQAPLMLQQERYDWR